MTPVVTDATTVDFDSFYRREFDQQVRRAALIVGSVDLARDVVHDAFVGVYQLWTTLDDVGRYLNRSVRCMRCCRLGCEHHRGVTLGSAEAPGGFGVRPWRR